MKLPKVGRVLHPGKNKKLLILCVEDDPAQRELRTEILEKDGYSVVTAATSASAVRLFQKNPVCLVLADHMLQGSKGSKLALQLKKLKPDVPVVLHSGSSPQSLRNIDAFVHKGEPVARFLAIIRSLVDRYCA
ncbi:MAG TPA: response regulator [Terriglobales bacterium]|nr:response regulator [Terriglobales bacterium]